MTKAEMYEQIHLVKRRISVKKNQIADAEYQLKKEISRLESLELMYYTNKRKPAEWDYSDELKLILKTKTYQIGLYLLDIPGKTLSLKEITQQVTVKQSHLLAVFAANIGKMISRSYLLTTVWRDNSYHAGKSLNVYLNEMRRLLKDDCRISIFCYHGQGYELLIMDT